MKKIEAWLKKWVSISYASERLRSCLRTRSEKPIRLRAGFSILQNLYSFYCPCTSFDKCRTQIQAR